MSKWETPCPDACPPPTINLFCEPHPDDVLHPHRVIAKFSSLDESELAAIGLTREHVDALWSQAGHDAARLADLIADRFRAAADRLVVRAPDSLPKATLINGLLDEGLDTTRSAFAQLVRDRLQELTPDSLIGEQATDTLWREIATVAYLGAPCPDLTLKLSGQLGHFTGTVSGNAGLIVSTAGSAGVVANLNLVGVPVGKLDGYLAATDLNGNFNPSLCGQIEIEVGPVDIGKIAGSLVGTMSQDAARVFFTALGQCLGPEVIGPLARQVKRDLVTAGSSSPQILAQLDLAQQLALAGLLQKQPGLSSAIPCLRTALTAGWSQYNPELRACGEGQPRVLGLPTGPRLADLAAYGTKTRLFAAADASASGTLAYAATLAGCTAAGAGAGAAVTVWIFGYGAIAGGVAGGSLGLTVGAIAGGATATLFSFERGMVSMNFETPDPMEGIVAALDGRLNSPEQLQKYGEDGIDLMLQKTALGARWSLVPLGFKTASASARLLLPDWNDHPNRPGRTWIVPGTGSRASWPTPADLVVAMTRERVLPDASWEGTTPQILELLPEGPQRTELQSAGATLSSDYFPFGGYLSGFDLLLPRALVTGVPQELRTALDASANPLQRFLGAMTYVQDYIMTTTNVGALAAYVPLPGPLVFDHNGTPLKPHALLRQITDFDAGNWIEVMDAQGPELAARIYPGHLFFAQGYLQGTLLGVPIGNARLVLTPPDLRPPPKPPLFQVTAEVPVGSWLREWVDHASLAFELTQAPVMSIEHWSTNVAAPLIESSRDLATGPASDPGLNERRLAFARQVADGVLTNLPKARLEARLDNLHIPTRLASLLQAGTGPSANATLHAFSPRFAPDTTGTTPLASAQREGGVVLQGDFTFGNLVHIPNAEIAFLPNPLNLADPRFPPSVHARVENVALGGAAAGLNFTNASLELLADLAYPAAPGSREPSLHLNGRLASISLPPGIPDPILKVLPLDGQPDLGVTLDLSLSGQKRFTLSPGRLVVRGPLGDGVSFRLHGATSSDPFVYSATEPWTNRLTLAASTPLPPLQVGRQPLVQLQNSDLQELTLLRDPAGTIAVNASIRNGARLTWFPGTPGAVTTSLNASGTLRIGADGSFTLDASTAAAWSLAGSPVPAGAFSLRFDPIDTTVAIALNTATSVALGLFTLEPLTPGTPLDVHLALRPQPATPDRPARWDAGLSLPPCRLRLPHPDANPAPLIGSTATWTLDGGPDPTGQPRRFMLSNDGTTETIARITSSTTVDLWARNVRLGPGIPPSTEVFRYEGPAITGTLHCLGQSTARLTVGIPASGRITIAPSVELSRRQFRVGPGDLEVTSDGTFRLRGKLADVVESGVFFSFAFHFGVGSDIEVTQSHLVLGLEASTVDNIRFPGLALSGQARFTFDLPYLVPSLNGTLSFPPLDLPFLDLLPLSPADTRLSGSLSHDPVTQRSRLAFSGARLRLGNPDGPVLSVPPFDLNPDGTFETTLSLVTFAVPLPGGTQGLPLRDLALTFRRASDGDLSVRVDGARLALPGWPEIPVTGSFLDTGPRLASVNNLSLSAFGFTATAGLSATTGPDAYASLILSHNPEAYWRLSDSYTAVPPIPRRYRVRDETGRHTTTVTNAPKVSPADVLQNEPGVVPGDTAFAFSSGNAVVVGDEPAFDLTSGFSLEAWVRVRRFDRSWQTILSKGDTAWQLHRLSNTRKVSFATFNAAGWHDLPGTPDLDDDRWHHLVATFDGTTKRLYIDGLLDATTTTVSGPLTVNDHRLAIGANTEVADRTFNGWIDEVALYKRVLPDPEILTHAAAGFGRVAASLVVNLPGFGSGSGSATTTLHGFIGPDGAATFAAQGHTQTFPGGLVLANASTRFSRPANATLGTLTLEGDLNAPSITQLLGISPPLHFSGSSTGANLVLTTTLPTLDIGPGHPFQLSGAALRLSPAGLHFTGASLRVLANPGGSRAPYLTLALPDFALPATVPAGGITATLATPSFPITATARAGAPATGTHPLVNASFTLTWRPDALALTRIRATCPGIPGFPGWTDVVFQDGQIDTNGRLTLSAPPLPDRADGVFLLQNVRPVFTETGLRLTTANLKVGNLFRLEGLLPDLPVPPDANGRYDWGLRSPPALTLAGVPFSKVPATLRRAPRTLTLGPSLQFEPPVILPSLATTLAITNAELAIPGIPTFRFSGSIDSNGRIRLSHAEPNPIPFLGFTMTLTNAIDATPGSTTTPTLDPAAAITSRFNLFFNNQPFAAFQGTLATNGTVLAHGDLPGPTLGGFLFGPTSLDLRRIPGSSTNIALTATLARPAAWPANLLAPWPSFTGSITLVGGSPRITASAHTQPVAILGFPLDALDLGLNGPLLPSGGSTPALSLENGKLRNYALLPSEVALAGTLPNSGGLQLSRSLALSVAGFAAASGRVDLTRDGLALSGDFDLKATVGTQVIHFGKDNAKVSFRGTYRKDRTLLNGGLFTTASLQIGGFLTGENTYQLRSDGVVLGSGDHHLQFGNLQVPFTSLRLTSTGLAEFGGFTTGSWKCGACLFQPSAAYTVTLHRASANGSLSATLGGTLTVRGPTTPNGTDQSRDVGLSGGIGPDGRATLPLGITLYSLEWVVGGCSDRFGNRLNCWLWREHNAINATLW